MPRNAKSSSSKPKVFRRVYSRGCKLDAVLLVTQDGYSLAPATQSLGVHVSHIRKREDKCMPQDKQPFEQAT